MIEDKKLRISEIRRGIFIIERYYFGNPGKWIELNSKGEQKREVFTGGGLLAIADKSEYKYLKEAEEAMKDFMLFPRVVKEADFELTDSIDILLPKLEQHVFESNEILAKVIAAIKTEKGLYEEKENDILDNPI